MSKNYPLVLAIDTSCDETAVAVTQGLMVKSNAVASQVQLHKQYGGVFPTVAKQAHIENLPATVKAAMSKAGAAWSDIELIAVTQGPGLAPALEVGLRFAQELAETHHKPLVGVNHIEGHLWSVVAQPWDRAGKTTPDLFTESEIEALKLPALGVIVSGKHTDFILVEAPGKYQRLGWTVDDAAGECLDKVGRMLGLGYPAGPILEEFSTLGDAHKFEFPLPMTTSGDFNLSYSGLKTSARNKIAEIEAAGKMDKQTIYDLAASLQAGVFRHICHKLSKVLVKYPEVGEVWLGGGVAANRALRSALRQTLSTHATTTKSRRLRLRTPYSKKLCGDNAAMIGVVAWWQPPQPSLALDRQPRLSL